MMMAGLRRCKSVKRTKYKNNRENVLFVIEVTDDVIGLLLFCRGEEERGLGDEDHACYESEASQEPEDPAVFLPGRGPDTFIFVYFCGYLFRFIL
jgi:hypothetical protein